MPSKIRKICVELPKTLFNPELIMNSGQVFRMLKKQGMYHVYSGDKAIAFKRKADQYEFYATIEDWNEFWVNYFDFNTDYSEFNGAIENSKDEFFGKFHENVSRNENFTPRPLGNHDDIHNFSAKQHT